MRKTKELRYAGVRGDAPMVLVGHPVVYGSPTEIALPDGTSYTEVIAPGALDGADVSDSTLCVNHDDTRIPLARAGRTMQLVVSADGLHMHAELNPESQAAREAYEAVRRGDISGMSFAFTVPEGGSDYDPATNTRTIAKIAKVYEISLANHPAYADASVEARSAIMAAKDMRRSQAAARAHRIAALAAAARITALSKEHSCHTKQ